MRFDPPRPLRFGVTAALLCACESEAARDHERCVEAQARGDLGAATYACKRAAEADPQGKVGAAARERLSQLEDARARKRAEADRPTPPKPRKRTRPQPHDDGPDVPTTADDPSDAPGASCAELCGGAFAQCGLVETRAPTPGGQQRCEDELRACLGGCARDGRPR